MVLVHFSQTCSVGNITCLYFYCVLCLFEKVKLEEDTLKFVCFYTVLPVYRYHEIKRDMTWLGADIGKLVKMGKISAYMLKTLS